MPRDPRTYLWDARRAAQQIQVFIDAKTWDDYSSDALLRSAVERQFEIVGEALNRLRQTDDALAAQVPDIARIVAFRNLLIHGYASIDDRLVWDTATGRVAPLIETLTNLLSEQPPAAEDCASP
jgi:uncharacterized protein with HEPN domain